MAFGTAVSVHVLAARVQYNTMSFAEGTCAIVYWTPGFGDDLARDVCAEDVWRKREFSNPDGFRQQSYRELQVALSGADSYAAARGALLAAMAADPFGHAWAAVPLTMRGLRDVLPLALLALVGLAIGRAWTRTRPALFVVPAIFVFIFHVGVTHFRARYGLPMAFALAPFAAIGLAAIFDHVRRATRRLSAAAS